MSLRYKKVKNILSIWIQDILSEEVISLVRTHTYPSNVLTMLVQFAVLGQHLPKLNLFKDPHLSQGHSSSLGVNQLNGVKHVKDDPSGRAHVLLKYTNMSVVSINVQNR